MVAISSSNRLKVAITTSNGGMATFSNVHAAERSEDDAPAGGPPVC